jgi:hypothetical protein
MREPFSRKAGRIRYIELIMRELIAEVVILYYYYLSLPQCPCRLSAFSMLVEARGETSEI